MFDALSIGATGMQAQQLNVETIANNLANANTPAFKKGRVGFTDLMVREAMRAGEPGADAAPAVQRLGLGVGVTSVTKVFDSGELQKTASPLDVAIRGEGFLEASMPDGSSVFFRGGTLKVNSDGLLASPTGLPLKPAVAIPDNAQSLVIAQDGRVLATVANQSTPIEAGRIDLVRFPNPAALAAQGDNLYGASEASGEPTLARAGEDGAGTLAQGFLEGSNVKMVDEMVNLMLAQRAYEASVKVVQAADEMLGLVNNLRK
jgi:flagellar basal-body rod protein FlgG